MPSTVAIEQQQHRNPVHAFKGGKESQRDVGVNGSAAASSSSSPSSNSKQNGKSTASHHHKDSQHHSRHPQSALASTSALHEIITHPLAFDKCVMNPAQSKYRPINEEASEGRRNGSSANGHGDGHSNGSNPSQQPRASSSREPMGKSKTEDDASQQAKQQRQLFAGKIPLVWPNGTKNVGSGLQNRGNTCYMNSVMQSLVHTAPLTHLLLSHEATHLKGKAGGELRGFDPVQAMKTFVNRAVGTGANSHSTYPREFITNLKAIARTFSHGRQEDAHEWLRLLLDSMHQSCIVQLPQKAKISSPIRETTFIHRTFGGKLRSRVKCLSCQHNSDTFETMLDLSLDIRKSGTLKEAMDLFTEKDQLRGSEKYKCEKCKRLSNAVKYYRIADCPQVLTVHLKRFTFTGSKNNKPFAFPLQIKMSKQWLCDDRGGGGGESSDSLPTYSLYAIVHHYGGGPHSGHYVADVKGKDGRWHTMNDDMVSTTGRPGSAPSKSAYILFYARNPGESLGKVMRGEYSGSGVARDARDAASDESSSGSGESDDEGDARKGRPHSSSNGVKETNGKHPAVPTAPASTSQFALKRTPSSSSLSTGRFSADNGPKIGKDANRNASSPSSSAASSILKPIAPSMFHNTANGSSANGKRKAMDVVDDEEDLGEGVTFNGNDDDDSNGSDGRADDGDDGDDSSMSYSAARYRPSGPILESGAQKGPPPQSRKAKRKLLKQQMRLSNGGGVRHDNGHAAAATATPSTPSTPSSPHKKQKMSSTSSSSSSSSSVTKDDGSLPPPASSPSHASPPEPQPPRRASSFSSLSPKGFGSSFLQSIAGKAGFGGGGGKAAQMRRKNK